MNRYAFRLRSGNRKTGPIPVTSTDPSSCPPSCPLRGNGCYCEHTWQVTAWRSLGWKGIMLDELCTRIRRLPPGTLWRHNEGGDLPGEGDAIDAEALAAIVTANERAKALGFTFTHRPVGSYGLGLSNARAIWAANQRGFRINLSADNLVEADRLASLAIAPVAVTVGSQHPLRSRTPQGRLVLVCLAQRFRGLTCRECGVCRRARRTYVIAFRAHGFRARAIDKRLRQLEGNQWTSQP